MAISEKESSSIVLTPHKHLGLKKLVHTLCDGECTPSHRSWQFPPSL